MNFCELGEFLVCVGQEYLKRPVAELEMPLWEMSEITAAKRFFPRVLKADVEEKWKASPGNARECLDRAHDMAVDRAIAHRAIAQRRAARLDAAWMPSNTAPQSLDEELDVYQPLVGLCFPEVAKLQTLPGECSLCPSRLCPAVRFSWIPSSYFSLPMTGPGIDSSHFCTHGYR